jgi:hypothetical protein
VEIAIFDVVAEGEFSADQPHEPFIEPSSTVVSPPSANVCRRMLPTTPTKVAALLDYFVGFQQRAAIS